MQCERAQELISARIDREIIFDDAALDDHLETCSDCRNELEGMRRLEPILWRAFEPEREAAETLTDKIRATLQERGRHVRRCTVLLVDDEPDILLLFRGLLADDFEVLIASNAAHARELFARQEIDIVLTDQWMPGETGVQFLEWLVANHPQTQRLLWTGYPDLDCVVEAVNRGQVFRYLFKPVHADEVRAALHAAARILQLEREHQRVLRDLSSLTVQLEERVKQRTQALEEANRELELRTQALEKFALTDALTVLPNRKALDHFVERELYMCRRFPASLAVAIIDVDFFRDINKTYHHTGGDQVLRDLARCMSAAMRKIDMLGRWAGDEFMLVAPQTNRAGALMLAERLRTLVEGTAFRFNGQRIPVTVTIGLAVLEAGRNADYSVVKAVAAAALARAKVNGRNCVELAAVTPSAAGETPRGPADAVSA